MERSRMPRIEPVTVVARAERVLFTVGATAYRRRDLVVAAEAWGDWDALLREAREEIACEARARDVGDPLDPLAVDEAAVAFRRARGLLAAEDLESWLAERDVSVVDWLAHLRRSLLCDLWRGQLDSLLLEGEPVDAAEVAAAAWTRGICTGVLADLADLLATEAAAEAALATPPADASGVPALADADVGAAALERRRAAHARLVELAVTSAGIARELEAHRLDWTSVDCVLLVHADLDVLREAALCVVDDGLELDAVALEAGAELRRSRLLVGELPPEVGGPLLAAEPGQLLDPVEVDGVAWLARLEAKTTPSAADPALRERAVELIAARARARALDNWVHWHERL
jgi:hypothetical protein